MADGDCEWKESEREGRFLLSLPSALTLRTEDVLFFGNYLEFTIVRKLAAVGTLELGRTQLSTRRLKFFSFAGVKEPPPATFTSFPSPRRERSRREEKELPQRRRRPPPPPLLFFFFFLFPPRFCYGAEARGASAKKIPYQKK